MVLPVKDLGWGAGRDIRIWELKTLDEIRNATK